MAGAVVIRCVKKVFSDTFFALHFYRGWLNFWIFLKSLSLYTHHPWFDLIYCLFLKRAVVVLNSSPVVSNTSRSYPWGCGKSMNNQLKLILTFIAKIYFGACGICFISNLSSPFWFRKYFFFKFVFLSLVTYFWKNSKTKFGVFF